MFGTLYFGKSVGQDCDFCPPCITSGNCNDCCVHTCYGYYIHDECEYFCSNVLNGGCDVAKIAEAQAQATTPVATREEVSCENCSYCLFNENNCSNSYCGVICKQTDCERFCGCVNQICD